MITWTCNSVRGYPSPFCHVRSVVTSETKLPLRPTLRRQSTESPGNDIWWTRRRARKGHQYWHQHGAGSTWEADKKKTLQPISILETDGWYDLLICFSSSEILTRITAYVSSSVYIVTLWLLWIFLHTKTLVDFLDFFEFFSSFHMTRHDMTAAMSVLMPTLRQHLLTKQVSRRTYSQNRLPEGEL